MASEAIREAYGEIEGSMAHRALLTQGACNLGGLVHALDEVVTALQAQALEEGRGTEWINRHPVVRLYVEQLVHLSSATPYEDALEVVEDVVREVERFRDVKTPSASA